jgi:aryl-alcohol dehydrogenase-like predicted oxidoreductase
VTAWTAAQRGATHILCGLRTVEQGIQNAGAGSVMLSDSDVQRMRSDLIALGDPIQDEPLS